MRWNDRVYGEVSIDDPHVLALIECPTFRRLRGIRQAGPSALAFPFNTRASAAENSTWATSVIGNRSPRNIAVCSINGRPRWRLRCVLVLWGCRGIESLVRAAGFGLPVSMPGFSGKG